MSEGVHVFIATTAGLVAIRAVQNRQGSGLASFVTISGGSTVAALTARYRAFVNKDTTPLPTYFPQDSYHMVIDADITQGQSWQLACATAHLLDTFDNLGSGNVNAGDTVIIATGEIEAGSAKVCRISHLSQKCLAAQKTVMQWQEQKCRVHFLVPQDNYQAPIPDIAFALQAVASIAELESYLASHNIISMPYDDEQALLANGVHTNPKGGKQKTHQISRRAQKQSSGLSAMSNVNLGSLGLGKLLSRFKFNDKFDNDWLGRNVVLKRVAPIVLLLALFGLIASLIIKNAPQPAVIFYSELQQFDTCNDRREVTQSFAGTYAKTVSNSYANRIAGKAFVNQAPLALEELPLGSLCEMKLSLKDFENPPTTLWLVSDSYARISLLPGAAAEQSSAEQSISTWQIPLPTWQKESRYYILMLFDSALDASDAQSLEAYLKQLHDTDQAVSVDALSAWLYRQSLNAYFITQTLQK